MTTDTRAVIIDTTPTERARHRSTHLPERFERRWRFILAGADAGAILFVSLVALGGTPNAVPALIVILAILCGITWQAGLYSRSFAVYPRDEIYYGCACVALGALPIALILGPIGEVPAIKIVLAIIFCALATSVVRVRLHLERRNNPYLLPGLRSITPHGWAQRESMAYRLSKRVFDLVVAALVLVVLSPVMLLIALAIAIESGRPILFRQERIGENAEPFVIYKFRTMRNDAGSSWVKPGDDRITRAGAFLRRTSLDELPQIFNVIRGEMSIVGPRPEMVDFAKRFNESIPNYAQRHVVTPGITGWAQLYFKRNLTPDDVRDVLPYDLFYVENASVVMDSALIFKTICEVLFHRAV